jgi:RPA family protein
VGPSCGTKTKTHIYHAIVKSTNTYAAETSCLKAKTVSKLNSTEMDFWRRSARISRKDKIRNTAIKQKMNVIRSLLDDIKTKQLKWYGHVQRMEEGRLPKMLGNGAHQEEENEEDLKLPGRKGLEDC